MLTVRDFSVSQDLVAFIVIQRAGERKVFAITDRILDLLGFGGNIGRHVCERRHFHGSIIHMAKVIACGPGAIQNLTDFFDVIWPPVIDRCSQLRLRCKFDLI